MISSYTFPFSFGALSMRHPLLFNRDELENKVQSQIELLKNASFFPSVPFLKLMEQAQLCCTCPFKKFIKSILK